MSVALAGCAQSELEPDSSTIDEPPPKENGEPPSQTGVSPWNQYRGDAQRTGSTEISLATWDVLGSLDLLQQELLFPRPDPVFPLLVPEVGEQMVLNGMGIVETADGMVGLARNHNSNQCFFIRVDYGTFDAIRSDEQACGLGWSIQGYDWTRHELLVCRDAGAGEPMLLGLAGDFEPVWSIDTSDFLLQQDGPFEAGGFRWTCGNIAREDDKSWVVPVEPLAGDGLPATGAYFSHDGRLEHPWPMGRVAFVADQEVGNVRPLGIGAGEDAGASQPYDSFLPVGSTLVEGGFILPGLYTPEYAQMDASGSEAGPLNYWSQGGAISNALVAGGDNVAPPSATPYHGATTIVSRNNAAFHHIGNYIIKVEFGVDGQEGSYTPLPDEAYSFAFPTTAPVVSGSKIHFYNTGTNPVRDIPQVLRFDAQSDIMEIIDLPELVLDWLATPEFLLAIDLDTVVVYDLQSLKEVKRLTTTATLVGGSASSQSPLYRAGGGSEGGLAPIAALQEIWVWDRDGVITRLGAADPEDIPLFTMSHATPKVGERLEVKTGPPAGDIADIIVSWGDGSQNAVNEAGEASYEYGEPGIYTVSLMALFDDGRTATAQQTVDVGSTPPTEESWVAGQFRENPDASWGIVGLTVTAIGALVAFVSIRAKRARLRRELEHIVRAAKAADANAAELAAAMRERRAHVRGLVLDGRIDEGQLRVLEARIDELARDHRMGALGDKFDFLPHGFVKRLEGMLADGRISGWEEQALGDLLDGDKALTAGQRTQVRRTLRRWAKEDA